MKVIKKETIINIDHKPKEKKNRLKSKRDRAVKNVLKGLLKMSFEQNIIVRTPKAKGIIFSAKNSFFENRSLVSENDLIVSPAGNLNDITSCIRKPPKK